MSGCKIVKTIFSVITIASFVLLLTQYKADLLSIWYSDPNLANTGISFSASIKSTYGSFSFLFFIFGLSFPLIAAFINNKTASLVLSSLSFAFLIPYVFELTQYYFDTYMSL
ncbi:MAG TPA: hypothetical protein DCR94_03895, partial [Firmicutes bacterium]|nr:hypothetical protein [Bacillota bacterium]